MRDVSYNDIDSELPRAKEEGEQVQISTTPTMEMEMALPIPTEERFSWRNNKFIEMAYWFQPFDKFLRAIVIFQVLKDEHN